MSKPSFESATAESLSRFGATPPELSDEDKSKDAFFVQVAQLTEAMIARHGKDFAMGTLVLSARFVAENRPLTKSAMANAGSPQPHAHKHDGSCCKT